MNKKLLVILITFSLIVLSGCQLAKEEPEAEEKAGQDRLIGAFVTTEEVLPNDMDGNWKEYGESTGEKDEEGARIEKMILPGNYDEENSKLVFPGLDGYIIAATDIKESILIGDLWNCDMDIETTDSGENIRLSGTLYVGKNPEMNSVNVNYIYQTEEGLIYLDGTGHAYSSDTGGDSIEYEEIYESDEKGKMENCYTKIRINVEYVEKVEKIKVFQYEESGELAGSENVLITGNDVKVKKASGAVWAVVEEQNADDVRRTVCSYNDEDEETTYAVKYAEEDKMAESFLIKFTD